MVKLCYNWLRASICAKRIREAANKRLSSGEPLLCNLGCGGRRHPTMINIDIRGDGHSVYSWDLRRGLPFLNDTCDALYSSHVIEHFDRNGARNYLLECYRVLKSGAILRLVTPDLEVIARAYLHHLEAAREDEPGADARYEWIVLELLDQLARHESGGEIARLWSREDVPAEDFIEVRVGSEYLLNREYWRGRTLPTTSANDPISVGRFRLGGEPHLWMYDRYSLKKLLTEIGFSDIRVCRATESDIEGFASYHLDAAPDGTVYKPDSFFMEGRKV